MPCDRFVRAEPRVCSTSQPLLAWGSNLRAGGRKAVGAGSAARPSRGGLDPMDPIFGWIENSAFSEWIRGSDCLCAFPAIVTLHNIGMAFLAGGSIAIDLRLLGMAPRIPLKPMGRFVPLLWLAFSRSARTGILLGSAFPTQGLHQPLV